jgi:hypothetical protein
MTQINLGFCLGALVFSLVEVNFKLTNENAADKHLTQLNLTLGQGELQINQ